MGKHKVDDMRRIVKYSDFRVDEELSPGFRNVAASLANQKWGSSHTDGPEESPMAGSIAANQYEALVRIPRELTEEAHQIARMIGRALGSRIGGEGYDLSKVVTLKKRVPASGELDTKATPDSPKGLEDFVKVPSIEFRVMIPMHERESDYKPDLQWGVVVFPRSHRESKDNPVLPEGLSKRVRRFIKRLQEELVFTS